MKLSLITLAAVAVFCVTNIAFASTTSYDLNLSDSEKALNITPSVTIDDDWTLDLTVSLTKSYNEWGTALLATGDNAYAVNYTGGFQLYLSQNSGELRIKTTDTDPVAALTIGTLDFSTPINIQMNLSYHAEDKVLTLNSATIGTVSTTTPLTYHVSSGISFSQLITGINGASTLTGELTVGTQSIPEPTTTTLSLLALASLALRHRRA